MEPRNSDSGFAFHEDEKEAAVSQWVLLAVRSRSERAVANSLRAKGFEVFLPMRTVRRQWSDRLKIYDEPLFSCHLFCKCLDSDLLLILRTPGVFHFYSRQGRHVPVPGVEIESLRAVTKPDYDPQLGDIPALGEPIEMIDSKSVRGILVERGPVCRVAICLDSIGRVVTLRVPSGSIKTAETLTGNIYIPFDLDA